VPVVKEDEVRLVAEAKAGGPSGERAQARLIRSTRGLAIRIARRYLPSGLPFKTLVSEGEKGAWRAVAKFDPSRSNRFSTYASWWIRQSIQRFIDKEQDVVPLPDDLHQLRRTIERESNRLFAQGVESPNPDDNNGRTLQDRVVATVPSALDCLCLRGTRVLVRAWVETLPADKRRALKLRFGLWAGEDIFTLREIATTMGCKFQWVKQLEERALEILRASADDLRAERFPRLVADSQADDNLELDEKLPRLLLAAKQQGLSVDDCFAVLTDLERTVFQLRFRGKSVSLVEEALQLSSLEVLRLGKRALKKLTLVILSVKAK